MRRILVVVSVLGLLPLTTAGFAGCGGPQTEEIKEKFAPDPELDAKVIGKKSRNRRN